MPNIDLFNEGGHRNILLEDFGHGLAVQANQHLIVHGKSAMLLDPGGHKVYPKARSEVGKVLGGDAQLTDIFLSHQDPDIVAALNGWLMTTDANAYVPSLWVRFITHFGVDKLVSDRITAIGDEGTWLKLGDSEVALIPAHFLHSPGNLHVYDPVSKVLYSGDLGASLGQDYYFVEDFDAHLQYMEGFHRRYMPSNAAMQGWATLARELDLDLIAPQHGAMFKGADMCKRFIDWCAELDVGLDHNEGLYKMPSKG